MFDNLFNTIKKKGSENKLICNQNVKKDFKEFATKLKLNLKLVIL